MTVTTNQYYPLNANIRLYYHLGFSKLYIHATGRAISESQFSAIVDCTNINTIDLNELTLFINKFDLHMVQIDSPYTAEPLLFSCSALKTSLYGNSIEINFSEFNSDNPKYINFFETIKKNLTQNFTCPIPSRNPLIIKNNPIDPK